MQNFIPANIVLAGRTYRLKIKTEDEEKIRAMAKKLNDQLTVFKTEYAGKDMQDYLAMVLLWHVSEKMDLQPANEVETTQLDKIENLIDKGLEY
jgi:cell division protein ZapA (FtsZ GTPase activity inhibitor)